MAFINYAHRGASAYAPENTFAAFYMGCQMGANGIETDIQATADGVPVLFHDDTLQRVAGRPERIADMTCDELRRVDVGGRMGEGYRGESVPTLEEFLHHFSRKGLHLTLEIKREGVEEAALRLIERYCEPEQTVITSFQWNALLTVRRLAPAWRTGYLCKRESEEILLVMREAGIRQYCPDAKSWTAAWDRRFRDAGFSIRAWGVANEELMRKMLDMRADGMTVNFPDKLAQALRDEQK